MFYQIYNRESNHSWNPYAISNFMDDANLIEEERQNTQSILCASENPFSYQFKFDDEFWLFGKRFFNRTMHGISNEESYNISRNIDTKQIDEEENNDYSSETERKCFLSISLPENFSMNNEVSTPKKAVKTSRKKIGRKPENLGLTQRKDVVFKTLLRKMRAYALNDFNSYTRFKGAKQSNGSETLYCE